MQARLTQLRNALGRLNPAAAWKQEFAGYGLHSLQQDLVAGVTVGIVALPLALAFGISSGAGPASGLATAIVAGLLASAFGGSRFQITGPTGAMTVVLLPLLAQYGLEKVFVVGMMAGALLIGVGLLQFGRFVSLIPWPVVTGFSTGIGVVIFLQQLPFALGLAPQKSESILSASWQTLQIFVRHPQWTTVGLTLATIAFKLLWQRVSKRVPGSIVALLAITALSAALGLDVPRIGAIPSSLAVPQMPTWAWSDLTTLFPAALAIAVLAGIESLLSAVVADGMTIKENHDPDRELLGQGVANLVVPFFGGIPATGAIARTAVGVRSGGQTRLTGIVHALFLLAVVLVLGRYVAWIPLSTLAGILMVTAYRMIEFDAIKALASSTRADYFTMLLTGVITVGFNLILAIEIGLVTAGALFIHRMIGTHAVQPIEVASRTRRVSERCPPETGERILAFRVDGPLFFGVAGSFLDSLKEISKVEVLILRMRRVPVLDASGAHALDEIHRDLAHSGVVLLISGLQPQPMQLLDKMGLLAPLTAGGQHLFESTDEAIAFACRLLLEPPTHGEDLA